MAFPFTGLEVDPSDRPQADDFRFDLDRALSSVVALEARVESDAFTADVLGTERVGNGVVLRESGVVATIGYLVTEAQDVTLTTQGGRRIPAHVLGVDAVSGFGLVHTLEPLDLPALPLGDSRRLAGDHKLVIAGGGGAAHAAEAAIVARQPFAGYWEYLLDEALFTTPAHPHWSGAALIGARGELVGMGSLRIEQQMSAGVEAAASAALNMCVPAERLADIYDDLVAGRTPGEPRPWLGLFAQELDQHLVVLGVSPRGPVARAELKRGDLILALNDQPVETLADFYRTLWALGPPGVTVQLRIAREGDVFDVEVRTADRGKLLKKPRLN